MKKTVLAIALGLLATGSIAGAQLAPYLLPNAWHIAAPSGPVGTVGTLPSGIALTGDGAHVIVTDAGYTPRGKSVDVRVLNAATLASERSISLPTVYGAPLRDATGDGMWIADTQIFGEQIAHIEPASGAIDRTLSLPSPFFASALARSPDGTLLAVAGDRAASVALIALATGHETIVSVGRHPAALAFSRDGKTLFVADRGERFVDAIDLAKHAVISRIRVGLHPAALAIDARHLYVADSDDDDVAIVDVATRAVLGRVPLPFARGGVVGSSPNALVLDSDRLYVSCGAANAIAVYHVGAAALTPLGAIPTGWYPTALALDRAHDALYIVDGKGEGGHANPTFKPGSNVAYIASNLDGSVRRIAIPNAAALRAGNLRVEELAQHAIARRDPIVRAHGPIEHIIYIIKENRTYDQVLGDVPGADGDPALVMFGAAITPNQHALVARFGIFDRFFDNAHVSADGHNWSLGAFANDYLEKMWPLNYAGRRPDYDFEDGAEASSPHAGYLWDAAARAHISARNYGEFVTAGPTASGTPVSTTFDRLRAITDPNFPTFDLKIADAVRYAEWKREFDAFERTRTLPALEIVRFMRDHTAGTAAGENTPQAMVADNDQAVGNLVDAVSHSRDWTSTAIFILEDDAQNGADHVDEQRSTFYLASPYARGGVQHEQYTTASVLRTIEILLGMQPLSRYDAGAQPLDAAFTPTPSSAPFDARAPETDLNARNSASAYRAADSAKLDLAHADDAPPGVMNDILWHATRGAHAPLPPFGEFTPGR